MKGFITIETDDNVYWYVDGVEVGEHPDLPEDEYYYEGNFDKADELHNAHTSGAGMADMLAMLGVFF